MAPENYTTPQHCPGFKTFENLSAFTCKCPECGAENEIFSDEFDRPHKCSNCGKPIDFTKCSISGTGSTRGPR